MTAKITINIVYFILMGSLLELVNNTPIVGDIFRINSGTVLDLSLNVLATILAIVIMMLWGSFLIRNIKHYYNRLNSKAKTLDKEVRCSVFNPFC